MKHLTNERTLLILIILLSLAKLYNIEAPIGGPHAWRQSNTAAVARAMYREEYNLFYPRIPWRGDTSGYHESEFPLYNFMTASLYYVFGFHDFIGKILSWFFHLTALYLLYLLAQQLLTSQAAIWAAIFFAALPLNGYYARAFMPESLMLCTTIGAIYFLLLWRQSAQWRFFFSSMIMTTISALVKLPSLYVGLPLVVIFYELYGRKIWRQAEVWLYGAVVLIPTLIWYAHGLEMARQTGLFLGILTGDKIGSWAIWSDPNFYIKIIGKWLAERHLTYSGFIIFLIGLVSWYRLPRENRHGLISAYGISLIIYIMVVAVGAYVHEYYILPLLPFISLMMGHGADQLLRKLTGPKASWWFKTAITLLFLTFAGLSLGRYTDYLRKEISPEELAGLAAMAGESGPNDLFLIWDELNPTLFYYLDRHGWRYNSNIIHPHWLKDLIKRGLRFAFIRPQDINPAIRPYFQMIKIYRGATRWNGFTLYRVAEPIINQE